MNYNILESNDDTNFDVSRDVGSVREYPFGTNKIIAERKDPFGLWSLHFASGTVPVDLQGSFTSLSYAEVAINNYFARKKLEASVIDAKAKK